MRKKRYRAAGGVVIHQDQMLLLDRPSRGEVRLPKGHIEPDEIAQEAALREVAEESGYCDLEVLADLGSQVVEFDFDGSHYMRDEHYFLAELVTDQQLPRDKKDATQFHVIWVPFDQATAMLTYAAEQEIARKAVLAYRQLSAARR
jgi:8-oxo-dGTP pyrophosphatase MutT (NUDIX family)